MAKKKMNTYTSVVRAVVQRLRDCMKKKKKHEALKQNNKNNKNTKKAKTKTNTKQNHKRSST